MKKGFTLVELMIIIALCGILFSICLIPYGNYRALKENQRVTELYKADMTNAFITSWSNYYEVVNLVEQSGLRIYTLKDTKISTVVIIRTNNNTIITNHALNDMR
jgi:prepilin-type N-terminal cleavage/methylation domain-containing protein